MMKTLSDIDVMGKRVLIREDLNVPLKDGCITSETRIKAALPTIQWALEQGAAVMLLSHLGRPKEGEQEAQFSLAPVAERLSQLLGQPVRLEKNWLSGVDVKPGDVVLCENVRFNAGEKANDETLSKQMAALCDVFVMDAFGTAHRAQASTAGVAKAAPLACAGPLLTAELSALDNALKNPASPLMAIVGGAKVSSKLKVLESLLDRVDQLIVGGGIANTFLLAKGHKVGASLCEPDLVEDAKRILEKADAKGIAMPLPVDVVVTKEFSENAAGAVKSIDGLAEDDLILDIGPRTIANYVKLLETSKTIVWNGPVGVFEFDSFAAGTEALAMAIAKSSAFSIAGGGDTLAAIEKYGLSNDISYISTGGGAFLAVLEGEVLPGVAAL